jgi:L-lactate utilization protein LutB
MSETHEVIRVDSFDSLFEVIEKFCDVLNRLGVKAYINEDAEKHQDYLEITIEKP